MKVRLYGASVGPGLEWRISLEWNTDCTYWFEQYGGKVSLHLLEPVLSLGEAWALLRELDGTDSLQSSMQRIAATCRAYGFQAGELRIRTISFEAYRASRVERPELDTDELVRMEGLLGGRCFSKEELLRFLDHHGLQAAISQWTSYVQAAYLRGRLKLTGGVERERRRRFPWSKPELHYRCCRCGTGSEKMYTADCIHCSGPCVYCEECLTMGRMQTCSLLLYGLSVDREDKRSCWEGQADRDSTIAKWGLSPAQTEAARQGLAFLAGGIRREPGRFLIWAVTGAGKTEMIFPFIDYELNRGRKVLIATPRRDVVLELQPRLKRAFPDRSVVTLYGGSEERWDQGEITLSTTHQLLRFYRSFDLVIIDEIDAYPYHNNPMLQAAAQQVCTSDGAYVLLSATPPAGFIRDAERGRLEHVKVPVRFHRHPLPVPRILKIKVMSGWKGRVPSNLKTALQRSIDRGAQLFVFVPKIREVEPTVEALRRQFPGCSVEGTSSQDPHRADKVTNFRQGNIRLLVTTTILERGVTVPRTDVFILEADSGTFDSAALVQMAGRAGRSKDDPNGRVFFAAAAHTQSQARAIRQIRQMNRLAKRKGYLLEHP